MNTSRTLMSKTKIEINNLVDSNKLANEQNSIDESFNDLSHLSSRVSDTSAISTRHNNNCKIKHINYFSHTSTNHNLMNMEIGKEKINIEPEVMLPLENSAIELSNSNLLIDDTIAVNTVSTLSVKPEIRYIGHLDNENQEDVERISELSNVVVINESSVTLGSKDPSTPECNFVQSQVCSIAAQFVALVISQKKRIVVVFKGPSGAGKTTLCNQIRKAHEADTRVIHLNNDEIRSHSNTPYSNNDNNVVNAITNERFEQSLRNGYNLILLDNVNILCEHFDAPILMSKLYNTIVVLVDLTLQTYRDASSFMSTSKILASTEQLNLIIHAHLEQGLESSKLMNSFALRPNPSFNTLAIAFKRFADFAPDRSVLSYFGRTIRSAPTTNASIVNQYYNILSSMPNVERKVISIPSINHLQLHQFSFSMESESDDPLYDRSDIAKRYLRRGIVFLVNGEVVGNTIALVILGMRKFINYFGLTTPAGARYNVVDANRTNQFPTTRLVSQKEDGQAVFVSGYAGIMSGGRKLLIVATKRDAVALTSFNSYKDYVDESSTRERSAVIKACKLFEIMFRPSNFEKLVDRLHAEQQTLVFEMMTPDFDFRIISNFNDKIHFYLLSVVDHDSVFSDGPTCCKRKITSKTLIAIEQLLSPRYSSSISQVGQVALQDNFFPYLARVYQSETEGVVVSIVQKDSVQCMIKVKSTYYLLVRRQNLMLNRLYNHLGDKDRVSTATYDATVASYKQYVFETIKERFVWDTIANETVLNYTRSFIDMCASYDDQTNSGNFISRWDAVRNTFGDSLSLDHLIVDESKLVMPSFTHHDSFVVPEILEVEFHSPPSSNVVTPVDPTNDNLVPVTIMMKQSDLKKFINSTNVCLTAVDNIGNPISFEVTHPTRAAIDANLVHYSDSQITDTVNVILNERLQAAREIVDIHDKAMTSMGYDKEKIVTMHECQTSYNPHCLQSPRAEYINSITHHISDNSVLVQYCANDNLDRTTPINFTIQQLNAAINSIDRILKSSLSETAITYQKYNTNSTIRSYASYQQNITDLVNRGSGLSSEGNVTIGKQLYNEIRQPELFSTAGYKMRTSDRRFVLINPTPQTVEVLRLLYPYIELTVFSSITHNVKAYDKINWVACPDPVNRASQHISMNTRYVFSVLCFIPRVFPTEHKFHEICTYLVSVFNLMNAHAASNDNYTPKTRVHHALIEIQMPILEDEHWDVSQYKSGDWKLFDNSGMCFVSGEKILPIFGGWRSNSFFVYTSKSRDVTHYDINKHCDIMYNYNINVRSTPLHNHYSVKGFDHCHDCVTFLNTIETHTNNRPLFRHLIEIPKTRNGYSGVSVQSKTSENVKNIANRVMEKVRASSASCVFVFDQVKHIFPAEKIRYGVTKDLVTHLSTFDTGNSKKPSQRDTQAALRQLINSNIIALSRIASTKVIIDDNPINPYFCTKSQGFDTFFPLIFLAAPFHDVIERSLSIVTANAKTLYATYSSSSTQKVIRHDGDKRDVIEYTVVTYNVSPQIRAFNQRSHDKIWNTIYFVFSDRYKNGVQYVRSKCYGRDVVSGLFMTDYGIANIDKHFQIGVEDINVANSADMVLRVFGDSDQWASSDKGEARVDYTAGESNHDIVNGSNIMSTLYSKEGMCQKYSECVDMLRERYSNRVLSIMSGKTFSTLDHSHDFQDGYHTEALRTLGSIVLNAIPQYVREMQKSISAMTNNSTKIINAHAGFTMYKSSDDHVLYMCETCCNIFGTKLQAVVCNSTHISYVRCRFRENGEDGVKIVRLYSADIGNGRTYKSKNQKDVRFEKCTNISMLPVSSKPCLVQAMFGMVSVKVGKYCCDALNQVVVKQDSHSNSIVPSHNKPMKVRDVAHPGRGDDGHSIMERQQSFTSNHSKPSSSNKNESDEQRRHRSRTPRSSSHHQHDVERNQSIVRSKSRHERSRSGFRTRVFTRTDAPPVVAVDHVVNKPVAATYHPAPSSGRRKIRNVSTFNASQFANTNSPVAKVNDQSKAVQSKRLYHEFES